MKIATPVTPDGRIQPGWGRAATLALATVTDGAVSDWTTEDVRWDIAHDTGTDGAHHARVVTFLREQGVTHVIVLHMGQGMANTLEKMGIEVLRPDTDDARAAVEALAATAG